MRPRRTAAALALALAGLGLGGTLHGMLSVVQAQDREGELGGLPPGPGREEVYYTCSACHSLKLVQQQGLSRERWDKLLVWMVEAQGMPEPSPEERALILGYLAEHYGPESRPVAPGGFGPPLTPLPQAGGL